MVETRVRESLDYTKSSPSTTEAKEPPGQLAPIYDIDPGTGKGTGKAEYDTSKPTRIKFKVKLIEEL